MEQYIDEIPVYASANPLIAGEELFSSDKVCGTKNDNTTLGAINLIIII